MKKIKGWKFYGSVFSLALLIVLLIRAFLIQSYTISSPQMETALLKGDRVLVDKTAYGIRLPITVLSFPFVFDRIFGVKSYFSLIELDYRRIASKTVRRNDIVLFNNPVERNKPIDKRSLLLSRCVAIPGDTILMEGYDFLINGKKYIPSPDMLMNFRIPSGKKDSVVSVLNMFSIPVRYLKTNSQQEEALALNRYEAFIVNQRLTADLRLEKDILTNVSYSLIVPAKKKRISLNEFNSKLYSQIVADENPNEKVEYKGGQIIMNNEPLKSYMFKDDYYWFISDNPDNSVDSRSIGFISERFIIGRAFFIWYSSNEEGKGEGRSFSSVE